RRTRASPRSPSASRPAVRPPHRPPPRTRRPPRSRSRGSTRWPARRRRASGPSRPGASRRSASGRVPVAGRVASAGERAERGPGVSTPEPAAGAVEVAGAGARATGDAGRDAAELVASHVLDVVDFPQPGIVFKDLTPLFADGAAFAGAIDAIVNRYGRDAFDVVAGIEARGFMIGAGVALTAGVGFVP